MSSPTSDYRKNGGVMEKGKDRASKLFFYEMENAREIVGLALKKLGAEGDLSNITDEDPVVSFMGDDFSL